MHAGTCASTASRMDTSTPSVKVLPRTCSASPCLPSPKRSAHNALPPAPMSMEIAMNTVIIGVATLTAERPISPAPWPRNTESIILYAPFTSMPKIAGTANSTTRAGILPEPMRVTRSFSFSSAAWGLPPRASPIIFSSVIHALLAIIRSFYFRYARTRWQKAPGR